MSYGYQFSIKMKRTSEIAHVYLRRGILDMALCSVIVFHIYKTGKRTISRYEIGEMRFDNVPDMFARLREIGSADRSFSDSMSSGFGGTPIYYTYLGTDKEWVGP